MARYLARACPNCHDYLGVIIPAEPQDPGTDIRVDARCLTCGYTLDWKISRGKKPLTSALTRILPFLVILLFLAAPAFSWAEICPGSQVPKAELQKLDSALPIPLQDKLESEVAHLPWGFPGQTRLLYQREFIISYDPEHRVPVWVAYKLRAQDVVNRKRRNAFRTDPRLTPEETATCADYDEPIFDRGHIIPNATLNRSAAAQAYSFFLSNMAPQHDRFNRGIWAHFEGLVRDWALARGTVYVITGTVFDRNNDGEPDALNETEWMLPAKRVGIPSHFYKILFHAGATLESLAVMLPHINASPPNRNEFLRQHRVSIREIEKRTGLNFLPGLGPLSQDAIESIVAPDLWPTQ